MLIAIIAMFLLEMGLFLCAALDGEPAFEDFKDAVLRVIHFHAT